LPRVLENYDDISFREEIFDVYRREQEREVSTLFESCEEALGWRSSPSCLPLGRCGDQDPHRPTHCKSLRKIRTWQNEDYRSPHKHIRESPRGRADLAGSPCGTGDTPLDCRVSQSWEKTFQPMADAAHRSERRETAEAQRLQAEETIRKSPVCASLTARLQLRRSKQRFQPP
jgi:hypothetical protein